MIRKLLLKKRLKRIGILLIERYGLQKNYTIGQIENTMKKYNISKTEKFYYKLLLLCQTDYSRITGSTDYLKKRNNLYL